MGTSSGQQDIQHDFCSCYHALWSWHSSWHADQITSWEQELPAALSTCLELLIQHKIVALLWCMQQTKPLKSFVPQELLYLHTYLTVPKDPWAISIGHLIKRLKSFLATRYTSNLGSGAHCPNSESFESPSSRALRLGDVIISP